MSEPRNSKDLSLRDRKILQTALNAGHAFESSFDTPQESAFRSALLACGDADSLLVQRLSELAPKVSIAFGEKHLLTLLVPIERLMGRTVRDEEFLFNETDGRPPGGTAPPDFSNSATLGHRIVLCENVRSAFNVGSIYRTAETFGGREVWLSGYTPDPMKTAMGTDALIKTRRFDRTSDALTRARNEGFQIIALENAPGAVPLETFQWPEKTILILGNERFGVDSQTLAASDHVVRVSTVGQKNSLNVGVAFGVAAAQWSHSDVEPSQSTTSVSARTSDKTAIPFQAPALISPIGFVRGGYTDAQVAPRQGAYANDEGLASTAVIELSARFEGRPSNFEQALQDLSGFERAWIIFGFHESRTWTPQVRPPRGDGTKRGLFATRAPHRPNRLGISCVKLLKVDEAARRVTITEHDFLDDTPIYDIKPYVPQADAFPNAKAGWVDLVEKSAYRIHESLDARTKIDWLSANGEKRIRSFLTEQLTYQPLNSERKRIETEGSGNSTDLGPHHTIAFRTWRVDFKILNEQIEILNLRTGYSPDEQRDSSDPYHDKNLHRSFVARFQSKEEL